MSIQDAKKLVALAIDRPIWDRVFCVAPLVIIGSKEPTGEFNLAPKHMAMSLGLGNYFCFVCGPRHTTYHNIKRHGFFTVSYPRVGGVVYTSLAAARAPKTSRNLAYWCCPRCRQVKSMGSWSKVVTYFSNAACTACSTISTATA
jgi:hypothetical protein